jgi:hypothetical protein
VGDLCKLHGLEDAEHLYEAQWLDHLAGSLVSARLCVMPRGAASNCAEGSSSGGSRLRPEAA